MTSDSVSPVVASGSRRTRRQWQTIIERHRIRPRRSMGQNFLVDPAVVGRIADISGVVEGDLVVEIGPGTGILTRELLDRRADVLAVELDRELAAFLRDDLAASDRLSIVEQDARHFDATAHVTDRPYLVVANLPYSMATVIIRRFLDIDLPPLALHVMVQREVAERMTAQPPDMSLLGLACQLDTVPEIAFIVPPDAFLPPPKVESAVVSMRVVDAPLAGPDERAALFRLATLAFQRKRKTIANGLSQGLDVPKADIERALANAEIDPMRRPETLSVADWVRLASLLRV